jgi:hypothetical protein
MLAVIILATAPEGRHLDDFPPESHVGQSKTTSDQSGIANQIADLIGRGAGGHIEILGVLAQQQIADAAADDVGGVPGFLQTLNHLLSAGTDAIGADAVTLLRDDACLLRQWRRFRIGMNADRSIGRDQSGPTGKITAIV